MKNYAYYGRLPNGGVTLIFSLYAEEEPAMAQVLAFWRSVKIQQQQLDLPVPTMMSVTELIDLPGATGTGTMLIVPQNGAAP